MPDVNIFMVAIVSIQMLGTRTICLRHVFEIGRVRDKVSNNMYRTKSVE
jgi:hypothetical protein